MTFQNYVKFVVYLLILKLHLCIGEEPLNKYRHPYPKGHVYFTETFDNVHDFNARWIKSRGIKLQEGNETSYEGEWSLEEAKENGIANDLSLGLKTPYKHHAISTPLFKTFEFEHRPFFLQYEAKFQKRLDCGGAYVKLLMRSAALNLNKFDDTTPYTIMFGPDRCGNDAKLHFIIRARNKMTGLVEEKHCKRPSLSLEPYLNDSTLTHLFTLALKPDNTYVTKIDGIIMTSGSLLQDFTPPINPPLEIEDPSDLKPYDWDDEQYIQDPEAIKPSDWDDTEPEYMDEQTNSEASPGFIHDPQAPQSTHDSKSPVIENPECGEVGCGPWKPRPIKNPKYKPWTPPLIKNPNYKGVWKARKIPNPQYYYDSEPFRLDPISAIGLELWSTSGDILFDNFIITSDKKVLEKWTDDTYYVKRVREEGRKGVWSVLLKWVEAYPYLWFIYLTIPVLPIVVAIIYFCAPDPRCPQDLLTLDSDSDTEGKQPIHTPLDEHMNDEIIEPSSYETVVKDEQLPDEPIANTLTHRTPWVPENS